MAAQVSQADASVSSNGGLYELEVEVPGYKRVEHLVAWGDATGAGAPRAGQAEAGGDGGSV
jgi:hypothetical protein